MNRRSILSLSTMTALGLVFLAGDAVAQQKTLKEQLVGTWTLVSVDNMRPDGTKVQLFGPNPKGILTFDSNGRTSFILVSSGRPKFASNNRNTGTPEENKATVQGSIAFFGTWSVNEADKSLITRIDASTFPNQDGQEQKRDITSLTADELKYINPATTTGDKAETVWMRVQVGTAQSATSVSSCRREVAGRGEQVPDGAPGAARGMLVQTITAARPATSIASSRAAPHRRGRPRASGCPGACEPG